MASQFFQELEPVNSALDVEKGRRETEWFLGCDSSCLLCDSIHKAVYETAGGALAIISLRDPIVQGWRNETLGAGAPWVPTLFRVRDGKVQAWTGKKIAVRLAMVLGPRRAWRLAQAIAEVDGRSLGDENGLDRRSLLKGLSAVAASVALLNLQENSVAALSPEDCQNSMGYIVNFTGGISAGTTYSSGANCRYCPRIGSGVAVGIAGNTGVEFRGYTTNGGVVGGSPVWYRTSGPVGCWIHSSAFY